MKLMSLIGHREAVLRCISICRATAILLFVAVHSSSCDVGDIPKKTYDICIRKCAPNSGERPAYEACLLKCRNYIEEAMFRPRILEMASTPEAVDAKTAKVVDLKRLTRASGGKNHMFVRVGRSSNVEDSDMPDIDKRSGPLQMRGSFVRIGRQMSEQSANDESRVQTDSGIEDEDEVTKRRSGFVRIGRRGPQMSPSEQFVRIGRGGIADGQDDIDGTELSNDKRGSRGQAFVRIGRKTANFVRIGRAFVRIGKKDDESIGPAAESDYENTLKPAVGENGELVHNVTDDE